MRKMLLLLILTIFINAQNSNSTLACRDIAILQEVIDNCKNPEQILLKMGDIASKVEDLELKEFKKNSNYKDICHLKIVKSQNFGDFVAYSGYHYLQILKNYPKSSVADDAEYNLIYVITDDTYNFSDSCIEQKKLEAFIKKYPNSNKVKEAKARVKEIIKLGCGIAD